MHDIEKDFMVKARYLIKKTKRFREKYIKYKISYLNKRLCLLINNKVKSL